MEVGRGMGVTKLFLLFLVSCVIMQKTGAGFHTASTCFWNCATDGMIK